ncbi:MAG: fibronectin type III domain-containing protein [bacterium]
MLLRMPASSLVRRTQLLAIGLLALLGVFGCSNSDHNLTPGLFPFQLPINTGNIPGRTDPVLQSMRLVPGGGINLQVGTGLDLKAIGHFSDGTEADIADFVTWTQTNSAVGTLVTSGTSGGKFTAFNTGRTTIYAELNTVFSDATFVNAVNLVTPAPSSPSSLDGKIQSGNTFRLTWNPNPAGENVAGYIVYRSRTSAVFTFKLADSDPDSGDQLVTDPVVGTTFTDSTAVGGVVYYVVQALRRDELDPTLFVYGAPSRQLKVNFATGQIGEDN